MVQIYETDAYGPIRHGAAARVPRGGREVSSLGCRARLKPELRNLLAFYTSTRTYYATTRAYAATAFAGWRSDSKVSDRDFVIAAYQASQIYVIGMNSTTWATMFGADRLRTIDDSLIRNNLAFLMYSDTNQIDTEVVDTPIVKVSAESSRSQSRTPSARNAEIGARRTIRGFHLYQDLATSIFPRPPPRQQLPHCEPVHS